MSHRSADSITPCSSSTPSRTMPTWKWWTRIWHRTRAFPSSPCPVPYRCASVSASNPLQARIWCTVADMFLKVGKTSDALSCVQEAQFLAPHFPSVLLSYRCVMQVSDNEKASGDLYCSALALQSTNLISLTLIGQL